MTMNLSSWVLFKCLKKCGGAEAGKQFTRSIHGEITLATGMDVHVLHSFVQSSGPDHFICELVLRLSEISIELHPGQHVWV